MAQLTLPNVGPPPPVKKTVTVFQGTDHEMPIEITVQARKRGRRWHNEITEMKRKR